MTRALADDRACGMEGVQPKDPARSNRAAVRNPVLALPAISELLALPREQRSAIAAILADLVSDARERAQKSWRTNKGPMAAYWKAVGAYAEHIRRAVKPRTQPR